jgi:hypothetical protein
MPIQKNPVKKPKKSGKNRKKVRKKPKNKPKIPDKKKKKLWHHWQMAVVTNSLAQLTQFTWDQLWVPL